MSVSLLGVVGLQLYWINDAIKVKQEQFDRSVNEALTKVIDRLETQEAVSVVAHNMAALNKPDAATDKLPTPARQEKARTRVVLKPSKKSPAATATTAASNPAPVEIYQLEPVAAAGKAKEKEAKVKGAAGKEQPRYTVASAASIGSAPRAGIKGMVGTADSIPGKSRLYRWQVDSATTVTIGKAYDSLPPSNFRMTITPPDTTHVAFLREGRVYLKQKSASEDPQYKRKDIVQFKQIPDAATTVYRLQNQPVAVSVDTLRHLALKLNEMKALQELPVSFQPGDISSITVRNDSIFILQKDKATQHFFKRTTTPQATGSSPSWRETFSTAAGKPIHNAVSLPAPTSVKPAKQVAAAHAPASTIRPANIEKIEVKKDKLNDVVQQMVVEYVAKDTPLQERLNLHNLQALLKAELQQQGIALDFGYWVVSGGSDTVAMHQVNAVQDLSLPKYEASLFPNDIFEKSDYLGLYFPNSKAYALKGLWGMLALSVLFTGVIIATFGTTIHIIYKQKKLSEMKNDFINNMTHEFKTPIATISLATDAIANPKVFEQPEKIKYYTGIIREENKRMNAQVENVLQIAQLEKNEFRMNLQPVDVHALARKAVESIQLQVAQRLGQITMQLDALQHELRLDEVHLYNVICNLLDNANKYSPASPDICLVTRNVPEGLLIAVEDKGIGMSKDTQQRVFEKFYRVPTGNLHNVKGFGLGLSYVKAIVQAHHGEIKLRSELGKGSRFEIFLPFA
ncbi:His Kinase A (phospho-acceptor) domain-containing protein [Pontibacter akesuensis]|uniref:histidine kinase n=2 Tax=Pontibacter akesuensis TaxID=388950 RepID=A0A1I7KI23_9BACT|nr:hypothetical protein GCM10007389_36180 [Pontibacter akesuensis]SFU97088.1 His Kinase A (phospho-acceptor) domain-containing protein [Pontibacter akesuensis]